MSRIQKFYQKRFRVLAEKFGEPPEEFVRQLFSASAELSNRQSFHRNLALAFVHANARRDAGETSRFPKIFLCDAGLGGLARWLRAAGYESMWKPDLNDAAVIREAERLGATLVTSDTLMMERGVLRDGLQPSVCLPSSLTCEEQLSVLFRELGLELREPRCMACGGELLRVPKEAVARRIPPRTALWLDDYFVCAQCDQLFWRGTHWQNIAKQLESLARNKGTASFRMN